MFSNVLLVIAGVACAALGGEFFVRGVVGIAAWARVPAGVIGATVAAFATSSPELTVAVNASAAGDPEIALGDALGSNVVNLGLVIGVVLLLGPISAAQVPRRDAVAALVTALLLLALVIDGGLSRIDGALLLLSFLLWLSWTTVITVRGRSDVVEVAGEPHHRRSVGSAAVGLVFLIAAGYLLVGGAKPLGEELGVSTFVVGVVLVSLGTSMPELATAMAARLKGHTEVGVSTALGSNVFNTAFIVGVAAVIAPIEVAFREVSISLLFGVALIPVLLLGPSSGSLGRRRGAVLVGVYCFSVAALLAV